MRLVCVFLLLILNSRDGFSQINLIGKWNIGIDNSLEFKNDKLFEHITSNGTYNGTYSIQQNSSDFDLTLSYSNGSKKYKINVNSSNIIEIADYNTGKKIILKKVSNYNEQPEIMKEVPDIVKDKNYDNTEIGRSPVQKTTDNEGIQEAKTTETNSHSKFDFKDWKSYFKPSYSFTAMENNVWASYQLGSNLTKRDDKFGTILPPLGLHYERRVFSNIGLRSALSLNMWKESKVLLKSSVKDYKEDFNYYYIIPSLGIAYHLPFFEMIDPYFGFNYSYRYMKFSCDCVTYSYTLKTINPFIGIRAFVTNSVFGNLEIGKDGVGYIKLGIGFQF